MPRVLIALLASVIGITQACSTSGLEFRADWDHEVDFSGYRTFAWLEREGEGPGLELPEHLDIRLRRVVDDVLTDKGFERAPVVPQADLLLAYYAGVERSVRIEYETPGWYGPYRYGYWPGARWGTTSVREYATGTVVIDIVDRRTARLVWTGSVEGAVSRRNPSGERVQEVVERILREFPPAGGGA